MSIQLGSVGSDDVPFRPKSAASSSARASGAHGPCHAGPFSDLKFPEWSGEPQRESARHEAGR